MAMKNKQLDFFLVAEDDLICTLDFLLFVYTRDPLNSVGQQLQEKSCICLGWTYSRFIEILDLKEWKA